MKKNKCWNNINDTRNGDKKIMSKMGSKYLLDGLRFSECI